MKIGFDVDGVLADFNTAFVKRCIQVTGNDRFPPRPFDIPCWNYPEFYGYTEAETRAVWASVEKDRWFWENLPLYPETPAALRAINYLQGQGHDVYFITNRPGLQPKLQTETWLCRHTWSAMKGFALDVPYTVLLSGAKGLAAAALNLDTYIDDNYENVVSVVAHSPNTHTMLLNRSWTEGHGTPLGVHRIANILDILPTNTLP